MINAKVIPNDSRRISFIHPCLVKLPSNIVLLTIRSGEDYLYQHEVNALVLYIPSTASERQWKVGDFVEDLNLDECTLFNEKVVIVNESNTN